MNHKTSHAPSADSHPSALTSQTTSTRGSNNQQNFKTMTKKEIIEDLTHKVADIKYDLQVVLEAHLWTSKTNDD